jgi:hypothetical protein
LNEYAKSAGSFVLDTGELKVIEGIETTVFGLGEIVTAPFRDRLLQTKRRKHTHFRKPRLRVSIQLW